MYLFSFILKITICSITHEELKIVEANSIEDAFTQALVHTANYFNKPSTSIDSCTYIFNIDGIGVMVQCCDLIATDIETVSDQLIEYASVYPEDIL